MDQSELTSIAQQGTRFIPLNYGVQWVTCTPTEQQIIVIDSKAHKATEYFRMRPSKDFEWYDWRIMEEIDIQ